MARPPRITVTAALALFSRHKKGETLRQLAKESGVTPGALSQRFQTVDNPAVRELKKEVDRLEAKLRGTDRNSSGNGINTGSRAGGIGRSFHGHYRRDGSGELVKFDPLRWKS